MKTVSGFILFFCIPFIGKSQSLIQLREQFYRASVNSESADSFYAKMETVTANSSSLLLGYKGMASFILCNYSYNPYCKLKYFNEGKNLLDNAIVDSRENVELRFLRYSVQKNIPSFLGYYSNISDDKKIISKNISSQEFKTSDNDLYNRIVNFLSTENN